MKFIRLFLITTLTFGSIGLYGQSLIVVDPNNDTPSVIEVVVTKNPKPVKTKNKSAIGGVSTFSLMPPPAGTYNLYSDSMALVDLYNSMKGSSWTNKSNWLTGKVNTWFGIVVNATTQRVTTVQLNANNLDGTIPSSIGDLNAVTILRLFDNPKITGTIPSSIGNMTEMTILSLYNNALTGDIPSSLSNMTKMQQVRFHVNNLTGGSLEWVGSMPDLNNFSIYNNPNLQTQLPSTIGNCTKLTLIYAYNTKLYGSIPASLNSCTLLQQLYIHGNNLSGNLPDLGNLVNLTSFYLHFNYGITGSVPWIGNLTKMQILSIGDTGLSGSLPLNIGNLTAMTWLYISKSQINGILPASIVNCTKLQTLSIGDTNLSGSLPSNMGNLTLMTDMYIQKSQISGVLPSSLTSDTNLTVVDMKYLNMTSMPSILTGFTKMKQVTVNNNALTDILNFTTHVNKANLVYNVENNQLDFGDLEPHFTGVGLKPYKTFTYSPQQDIGTAQTLTWNVLTSNNLQVTTPGTKNLYQWQKKDNSNNWQDLSGKTTTQLQFNSVVASDSGRYRLKITNQWVTGLSLFTQPFKVLVTSNISAPTASDVTICAGNTATLNATGSGQGTIEWYDTPAGGLARATGSQLITPVLNVTTIYYVTEVVAGIPSPRNPITVNVNQLPLITTSGNVDICIGQSTNISVSGNATQYNWDHGLGQGTSFTVSPTTTTVYGITAISSSGCQSVSAVTVTVHALPVAAITPASPTVCLGSSITLTAQGGTVFSWTEGMCTAGISVNPTSNTTYNVTVSDQWGCSSNAQATVIVNPVPSVVASSDVPVCQGQSSEISVTGDATQYVWNNGLGQGQSFTVTPTTTTTYSVTGTGANGCQNTDDVIVAVHALPPASISPASIGICANTATTLTASGGIFYHWDNGISGAINNVQPSVTSTYTVTVTDNWGCVNSSQATVTVDPDCPATPTEFRAAALTPTQIKLTWNNEATNQTGVQIEKANGVNSYQVIATLAADVESYTDTNLQGATTYGYRIRSVKGSSQSNPSGREDETTFNTDQHYVRETIVLKDQVTNAASVENLAVGERIHTWNFLDGETRPLQQIVQEYSPAQNDQVQPVAYDALGRSARQYLPYTTASAAPGTLRPNAIGEQAQFYNGTNTPSGIPIETVNPFSETVFENSPLSRAKEASAQGQSWKLASGKTTKATYGVNGVNEVLQWSIVGSELRAIQYYDDGELIKTTQTDEQGNISISFTDKVGQTILQRSSVSSGVFASSYMVYDQFGSVIVQVSPLAVAKAESQSGLPKILDQSVLNGLCTQYKYDNRQRMTEMRAPGIAPLYYIYDKLSRPVLLQDANQRNTNRWLFTKYDSWSRPIISGLITDNRSASAIQAALENETIRFETRTDASGNFNGYTNTAFPTTIDEVFSVSYYDDYTFVDSQIADVRYHYKNTSLSGLPANESSRTLGIATGSKTKILGSNQYLWSVTYYDDEYQVIQAVATNHLGGIDRSSRLYNFPGWVTKSNLIHFEGDNTKQVFINKRYEYDHVGRLLRTFHKINGDAEVLLSNLQYNELGQVTGKAIHQINNSAPLQVTDYRYNIRGWLTGINTSSPIPGDPQDYFSEELAYDNSIGAGSTARFDGLVNATSWKHDLSDNKQQYNLGYDKLGRMLDADYKQTISGTEVTGLSGLYSEKEIGYDLNGNIKTLKRNSIDEFGLSEEIDQLVYDYQTNGNQLMAVEDNSVTESEAKGFYDVNTSGNDYIYDANGNLTQDLNKGFTITYNTINLPEQITFTSGDTIRYTYDASGQKLAQTIFINQAQSVSHTDYVGDFMYVDNTLTQILHDEGHIAMTPLSSGEGSGVRSEYHYYLADHLGSTRVVLQTVADTHRATATLETATAATEQSKFLYYNEAVKVNSIFFDHTKNGSTHYATRLNGSANERTGLAKSLSVMPGDTIKMEVFAKYLDTDYNNWGEDLANLIAGIANGTAAAGTFIDGGAVGSTGGESVPYIGLLDKSEDPGTTGPKAYLNWLVFDRNFKHLDGGYVPMTNAAKEKGDNGLHEQLAQNLVVKEAGYVYVWLSNENDTEVEVYFDDFKIDHIESPVVQINGFYPYGMTAYSYLRENEEFTNFLFQGKQYDSLTQFHDFHARQYDAALGRWFAADPAGQFVNPYLGMGNSPANGSDPDGQWFGIDDLAAAGIGFAAGYLSSGLKTGDWGKKSLIAGGIGAVAGWLAYNTAGLSASAVAVNGGTWTSANLGTFAINQGLNAVSSQFSTTVHAGNFSFGLSPAISTSAVGVNFSAGYSDEHISLGFSYSAGQRTGTNDLSGLFKSASSGGAFSSIGGSIGFVGKNGNYNQISAGMTTIGGKVAQDIGYAGIEHGRWGIRVDEDLFGDGKDRFLTGGGTTTYRVNDANTLALGFGMITGEPYKAGVKLPEGRYETYDPALETQSAFRGGAFYGGVIHNGQANFAGINSEKILHGVQNTIHDRTRSSYFADLRYKFKAWSYFGHYGMNSLIY